MAFGQALRAIRALTRPAAPESIAQVTGDAGHSPDQTRDPRPDEPKRMAPVSGAAFPKLER